MFLLTTLKIAYVSDPTILPFPNETLQDTEEIKNERYRRREDEFVCQDNILNALFDRVYDLYEFFQSSLKI